MNGSPLSNLRFPSLSNCERDSALYYLSSLCGPGSSTGISKNRTVSLNYSQWHRVSPKRREISLVAAQWAIFGSLWSGVQPSNRRTHAAFRTFLRRFLEIGDSLAERSEFELSVPFVWRENGRFSLFSFLRA
jgi:hypothetical protein